MANKKCYELKECEQKRYDCFAFRNGKCHCLQDTHFDYDCPFYKNYQMLLEDKMKKEIYYNDCKAK